MLKIVVGGALNKKRKRGIDRKIWKWTSRSQSHGRLAGSDGFKKRTSRLLFWILSNWRWRRFVDGDRSEWNEQVRSSGDGRKSAER